MNYCEHTIENNFHTIIGPEIHYDENEFSGTPRLTREDNKRPKSPNSVKASAISSVLAGQMENLIGRAVREEVCLTNELSQTAEEFFAVLEDSKVRNKQNPRRAFRDLDFATAPYVDPETLPLAADFIRQFDKATNLNLSRALSAAWNNGDYSYSLRNIIDIGRGGFQVLEGMHNGLKKSILQGREKHVLSGAFVVGEPGKGRVQIDLVSGAKSALESGSKRVTLSKFINAVHDTSWSFFNVKALSAVGIDGPKALNQVRPCDFSGLQDHLGRIVMFSEGEKRILPKRVGIIYITAAGVKVHQSFVDSSFLVAWARGLHQRLNTKEMTPELRVKTTELYIEILHRLDKQ